MRTSLLKSLKVILIAAFVVSSFYYLAAFAQEKAVDQNAQTKDDSAADEQSPLDPKTSEVINILVGDVQTIETKSLNRIAVTNPEIVDLSDAKPEGVSIIGKKSGQTEVFIWDNNIKRDITVRVATENLDTLLTRLQEVINKTDIKGISLDKNMYEGKVVVSGAIPKTDKETFDKIIDPFSDRIINIVKTEVIEDLVQVDMQITELSTTYVRSLGLDWSTAQNSTSTSGTTTLSSNTSTSDQFAPNYSEFKLPPAGGKVFNLSSFRRTTPVEVTVNALVQEGKGRNLANPRLLVISGKEASFLVGGEIPIKTTTVNATGGQSQENVTYKQYGVNVTVTPTIREGKIDVILNVQISDIDKSSLDTTTGAVGFITRQAQTQLFLDNKQTVVLAGLIKHADGQLVKGIPFLSKIPIVGGLFRTTTNGNPDADTELVITLTPTIIKSKKIATEQVVLPSKRANNFTKEVQSNFDKEPLEPKIEVVKPKIETQTKMILRPVLSPSNKVSEMALLPYVRSIQLRISQAISFPYEALQKNWEGTVKLRLRILKDGSLADCDLLESSGHDVFDKDAINTAKIVAPFSPFSADMQQEDLVVTVPIVYNQRAVSKNDTQTVVASY